MQKKLTQGNQSNYEIELIVASQELDKAKQQTLKEFQKDLDAPGFRKGFVPLEMVEQKVRPEHLQMGIFENIINTGIQEILKENPSIRFVGEVYDLNQKEEKGETMITMKLDVYPEIKVLNDKRESEKLEKLDVKVTQEEIDNAIISIKKNYADYKDSDIIALDTVSKILVEYMDKDGNIVDKSHIYVGEQEFAADKFYADTFVDKKKDETLTIKYSEKKITEAMISKKPDLKISDMKLTIKDIKRVVLPEINDSTLEKLFGKESTVKNEKDFVNYITEEIAKQKHNTELTKVIDGFLDKCMDKYMKVVVPKTIINEEIKGRVQNFEKQFGDAEKVQQYYAQIGEEQKNKMNEEIQASAKASLEKFFVLNKLTELLGLTVDRANNQNLEVETMIYNKLSGEETTTPSKKAKK